MSAPVRPRGAPSDRDEASPKPAPRHRRPRLLTIVGVLLIAGGLSCLGWVGYQFFGTNVVSERSFQTETDQLRSQWAGGRGATSPSSSATPDRVEGKDVPGQAIALLRIPRFGADYEVPIVQGTSASALAKGVGHYSQTAAAGAVGNFALAGHRITHGQPFSRLLELNEGDTIVVETRSAIFTYRLDTAPRDLTVEQDAGWVLDPVPGKKDAEPTQRRLTLTTCQDLFHSPDRSVAFGTLVQTQQK